MDGFGLVARIQKTASLATPVILMLTSTDHFGDVIRSRDLGVSCHIVKPVRRAQLRAAICKALAGRSSEDTQPQSKRPGAYQPVNQSPAKVLLAEDHPINQRLAARILEKAGHSVVLAANGREAVAAFETNAFDIILMDVQMPEFDGFQATAEIRRIERARGTRTPIIALTAHAIKGDKERCLAAGMDTYLSKPIAAHDLLERIDQWRLVPVGA